MAALLEIGSNKLDSNSVIAILVYNFCVTENRMTQSLFFRKVPNDVVKDSDRIIRHLESGNDGIYTNDILKSYFGKHWQEFKLWWSKNYSENIDWENFIMATQNMPYFIEWVFMKYPDVRREIMKDLDGIEQKSKE